MQLTFNTTEPIIRVERLGGMTENGGIDSDKVMYGDQIITLASSVLIDTL